MSEAKNVWTPDRGITLPNGARTAQMVSLPEGLFIDASTGKPIVSAVKAPPLDREDKLRDALLEVLGDLDDLEMAYNDVLVCRYIRDKVSEHLVAAPDTKNDDHWQGVVSMVVKVGPRAFVDDDQNKFYGFSVKRGDWVLHRHSDGWNKGVRGVEIYSSLPCRMLQDAHIRAKVRYPGRWF